jgi:3-oxoacyl-[acyl-carrier protein] reductase
MPPEASEYMSVSKPLEGKVALVTGASRGIGLAIAKSLSRMGAKIGLNGRDEKRLAMAAEELNKADGRAAAVSADLSRSEDIGPLVRKVQESLGPIEILINNAGTGYFGPVHEASEENWNETLDTNLKAVFLVSKAVIPEMIRLQTGHIINIASMAGKSAFAGGAIYCASKWGLLGLTQCMAEDLRPHGIRVSAICPGSVNTEFSPHVGKDPRKMLQPGDVARAVELIVTQEPQSFISEVLLRPTQKP